MLLGTIAYLAPELVTRGTADARSDIYALGIMLYEMLTGEQPYKGEQPMQIAYQHATDSVPRPSAKNPGVPEPLDELVLWATERQPDERPVDARAMLDRLREIEKDLGVHPQVVRPTPIGVVVGDSVVDSGELTKVLPGTFTAPVVSAEVDNATKLRRRTRRNSAKGVWLLILVLLLAGGAGTAGWWFGSGPGSLVAVPGLAGSTFSEAEDALAELGLVAVEGGEHTLEVDEGLTIRTEPGTGARLEKESEVEVILSLGPATVTLPKLQDRTVDEVTALLADAEIAVTDSVPYFTSFGENRVVRVYVTEQDGGEPVACADGCDVLQGSTAEIRYSLGPVPDVTGDRIEDAEATLADVGLKTSTTEEFSSEVDEGRVIRMLPRDDGGSWRPGETITLVVSKGPQLFEIPSVVGQTRDTASQILRDAGFEPSYSGLWNAWPDGFTEVTSQDPAGGEYRVSGTVVTLQLTVTG